MKRHVASRPPDRTRRPARLPEADRCTQREIEAFARPRGVARLKLFPRPYCSQKSKSASSPPARGHPRKSGSARGPLIEERGGGVIFSGARHHQEEGQCTREA